jgi:hypothetical protein
MLSVAKSTVGQRARGMDRPYTESRERRSHTEASPHTVCGGSRAVSPRLRRLGPRPSANFEIRKGGPTRGVFFARLSPSQDPTGALDGLGRH